MGTEASFTKKYYDPIMDGMAADCSPLQAETQESVSKELYGVLEEFVHRRDANVLARDLPLLQETIIHVRQSKSQMKVRMHWKHQYFSTFMFCLSDALRLSQLYREFRKYQRENDDKGFFKQYQ